MKGLMLIVILALLLSPVISNIHAVQEKEIKVAIYFSNVKRFAQEVEETIDYSWTKNGVKYVIKPHIISKKEIINGSIFSYDVFIIPGSGRHYFDAMNKKWRDNVIKFVESGGGYVGICGGANLASLGFNERLSPNSVLNLSVLKIANIYVNDQQDEEWQYLWKSNWRHGGPPINVYIVKNDVPIFDGFYGGYRSIRYWGGPGMYEGDAKDEKMGEIIPLAIYAEEPMEVAPLHYWKWKNGEWIPYRNVTTDIKGQYAAIATTYGDGRLVLFGPHPERKTYFDGHVEEFPVRPNMGPFTWFIYNWVSNNSSSISYNWWILRRSVAWVAGLSKEEMPYASQTAAYIEEPRYGVYFNGRKIIYSQKNIVIGRFSIKGKTIDADEALWYVDGELVYKGKGDVMMDVKLQRGKHIIRLIAINENEEAGNKMEVISL
ncbi:MAG TPA: hypothetical protein ENG71_00640 [Thermoplasmatales archaeon]|nr:hypothetical protein [Thermoplasmatales archaeon]